MSKFKIADEEVRIIAESLIEKFHDEIKDVVISYLFKEKAAVSGGKVVFGKCKLLSEEIRLISKVDYLIIIPEDIWITLSQNQKEALLLHEIKHIKIEEDEEGDVKLGIAKHDTEEFRDVISAYGLWTPDLEELKVAMDSSQV